MSKRKTEWWQQTTPARFPHTYLAIARERGADVAAILRRAQLAEDFTTDARNELTFPQMKLLVDAVVEAVGDDAIGMEVGLRLPPTAFGNLGYALLCSETIADVVQLCERYWHLLGRGLAARVDLSGPVCVVELTLLMPFPEPLYHLVYESAVASFYRGLQLLTDTRPDELEIWFSAPRPDYAAKLDAGLGRVRYQMPATQFRFSPELLRRKLPMHNPIGLKFALLQCEREEALLGDAGLWIREKVQREIVYGKDGYPTLENISAQLHMTPRTLRRRLEEEGTNYKFLLEEAKRRDAVQLLDEGGLEIQQIATLLGYQDPANFTRAFRQWTGQTPSQYRMMRDAS